MYPLLDEYHLRAHTHSSSKFDSNENVQKVCGFVDFFPIIFPVEFATTNKCSNVWFFWRITFVSSSFRCGPKDLWLSNKLERRHTVRFYLNFRLFVHFFSSFTLICPCLPILHSILISFYVDSSNSQTKLEKNPAYSR